MVSRGVSSSARSRIGAAAGLAPGIGTSVTTLRVVSGTGVAGCTGGTRCGSVGVPSSIRSPTGTGAFGSGMMLRSRAGTAASDGCDGVSRARLGSVARCRSFAASDAKRAGTARPYTSSTACTKRCSGTMMGSIASDSV